MVATFILGLVALALAIDYFTSNDSRQNPNLFRYMYQRYPFDDEWQYFEVEATSQEEANELAKEKFAELIDQGVTVIITFLPV